MVEGYFLRSPGNNTSGRREYTAGQMTSWTPVDRVWSNTAPGVTYASGTFYLDANCNSVPGPLPGVQACDLGSIYWNPTPISLVWNESCDVDDNPAFVEFPLELGQKKNWYVWKASSCAPLLVYDPEHKGEITSPTQLFGQWTFGGKRLASLVDDAASAQQKWSDGYEALETLDANGDRKITGEERAPLGLWFDANRDGISQPGEVRTLDEAGVTSVSTEATGTDGTGNTFAQNGYERYEGGQILSGKSVDWRGEALDGKYELLSHLLVDAAFNPPAAVPQAAPALPSVHGKPAADAPSLNGIWHWRAIDVKGISNPLPEGLFTLKDEGGRIGGHSFVESSFIPEYTPARRRLDIYALEGTKFVSDEKLKIQFAVTEPLAGRASVTSEAEVSPDGMRLTGRTAAKVSYHGKPITVTYDWVAERYPDD